jgi:hypothetical protein
MVRISSIFGRGKTRNNRSGNKDVIMSAMTFTRQILGVFSRRLALLLNSVRSRRVKSFTGLWVASRGMYGIELERHVLPRLAVLARDKGIQLWKPGDGIPASGRRFLIGFVIWNRLDFETLDAMCEGLEGDQIDMFMMDECRSQADFEHFVSGVGPVFQPPIIGVWEDGRLAAKGWGWNGRQVLAQYGVRIR